MSETANRNRLLTFLLLSRSVPMQEMIAELGTRAEVLEAIDNLKKVFKGDLTIEVTGEVEEIGMRIHSEDSLYQHLQEDPGYDFNDFRYRIAFLLHELITTDSYLNINNLSEVMNVSRSTVNNDLKKAKEILLKYNAQIEGIPNKGIHFVGDEFSKRLVLIYEVSDYIPMGNTMNRKVVEVLKAISMHYGLGDQSRILLYKTVTVSVYRDKDGQKMKVDMPMYKNFEKDSEELKWFVGEIESIYHISFSPEEIDFISFPINTRNSAYSESIDNSKNEEILGRIVHQMIERVRRRFMIHVDEKDFFSKVRYHLIFLINRLIFRIPVRDIFSDQIKIRFPLAFELAKISMHVLQEEYQLKGTKVDISYLAVYYALILDERKIIQEGHRGNRNVAVVTNSGRGTFELIKRQLQEIIGYNSNVDLLTLMELKQRDISKYQILFSTENIISDVHLPIIQIEGIIDQDLLTRKISELEEISQSNMEDLRQLTDISVMILDGNESYRNNVRLITDDLKSKGKASDKIYDLFLEKESVSSMIYENGVAFPHLTDRQAEKLSLTLGVLKPSKDKIRIIFFLLIPEIMNEKEEDVLMKIYDQIFRIISDKVLVRKLQEIESAADLTTLLMKGN